MREWLLDSCSRKVCGNGILWQIMQSEHQVRRTSPKLEEQVRSTSPKSVEQVRRTSQQNKSADQDKGASQKKKLEEQVRRRRQ